jgi:hypothetical protein
VAAPGESRSDIEAPAGFRAAVASMRAAVLRPEIFCEEMPAPQRIAPFSSAVSADVSIDDDELATGRLILLHDPAGNHSWGEQTFRCVAYCRAELDEEQAADLFFPGAAWSWLTEALNAHGAEHTAISGTVTRVTTEGFGSMAEDPATAQIELRASWSPLLDERFDVSAHVEAWGELLCMSAGLPPVPEGVAVMPSRRGQRG